MIVWKILWVIAHMFAAKETVSRTVYEIVSRIDLASQSMFLICKTKELMETYTYMVVEYQYLLLIEQESLLNGYLVE